MCETNKSAGATLGGAVSGASNKVLFARARPEGGYDHPKAYGNFEDACAQEIPSPLKAAAALLAADKEHRSLAADQVLMLRMVMPMLGQGLRTLQQGIGSWMKHQGFWSDKILTSEQARWEKSEKIALIHSEVSELLEGVREGKGRFNEGEECADIVIRVLDYCDHYDIDLAVSIEHKMLKNYQRPFKHGKAF